VMGGLARGTPWTEGNLLTFIILSTASLAVVPSLASPEYDVGLPTNEIWTDIVLLPGPNNVRVVREALPLNDSSDKSETSTLSETTVPVSSVHGYGTSEEEQGSSRGQPSDPLLRELDKTVDIAKDKIKQAIDSSASSEGLAQTNDTHKYYKQEFKTENDFNQFYRDLDTMNISGRFKGMVKEHSMLSQSYRRAATINLKFKFPFYGHEVENITIATGGFLYTGDYVHSWLAATQYIAPLMANFDTSNNQHAKIRYLDDGKKLVVEWKDVYLQERESEGPFTFQVVLHNDGDIWFAYQKIPIEIVSIKDDDHPVKVGLSDAYIIDRTIYFARRKTIYEYHRLNLKDNPHIRNETAIVFSALETCNMHKDCTTCLATPENNANKADLECRWCPELGRCSDGTDRNRQDWLKRKCDIHNVSMTETCSTLGQGYPGHGSAAREYPGYGPGHQIAKMSDYGDHTPAKVNGANPGAIVGGIFSCLLILALVGWVGYAYFNPNTSSGRFLIKYRPGAWRWRQSGGRYTAASIHM